MVDAVGHRYELTTIDEFEYIDPIDNSTSVAQVRPDAVAHRQSCRCAVAAGRKFREVCSCTH
jgi:hypothetical protein